MNLQIRQAAIEDAAAVYAIVQAAFAEYRDALPVSVGALDETQTDVLEAISAGQVLLALQAEVAVGTVRYEAQPGYLYVGRLAVLPACRGCGIGAALMAHIECLAPSLGRSRIQLGTRQSIPANITFYERLGYTIVERMSHPRGPDIVVCFEKELTPA